MRSAPAAVPKTALVSREQAHRRVILLSIGMLITLVISPLFSHHVVKGAEVLLAGKDQIGALCLIALHILLEPVHDLFHLVFLAGLAYASWDRIRVWRAAREVLRFLPERVPGAGSAFWHASRAAGVDPRIVRVVAGLPTPAFTIGWVRPHVFVAESLATTLTAEQLAAVLAHEGAHAARRDPLRLSLLRFLSHTLFWIPAMRRLADDVADEAEIQADDAAAGTTPLVLASAIVALAHSGFPDGLRATVGFHHPGLLERRVRRLLGEAPFPGSHLTRRSIAGASLALALMAVSGAIVSHPLPGGDPHTGHGTYCELEGASILTHLDCLLHGGTAHMVTSS